MHTELLGLSKPLLKLIAPTATHQNHKGGLYKFLEEHWDVLTQTQMVAYEHIFPYTPPMKVEDKGRNVVVYIPTRGKVKVRPKAEWLEKFEPLA